MDEAEGRCGAGRTASKLNDAILAFVHDALGVPVRS
jgi:hypothetical protein